MARPKKEKLHLYEKRIELMYALDFQGYNGEEIASMFNVDRSVVHRILKSKPKGWEPKWIKVQE